MRKEYFVKHFLIISMFVALTATTAFAQGTGFNFQGRLNDGTNPANGNYDLQFRLYNGVTGGAQIGVVVSRPATVLINGVFSTTLDFGATAFNNPNNVFIEISVKPANSPNAYTILGPRQQLTVVPFAGRAANATNADFATNATNATNAVNATNATNATNSLSLGGVPASDYARLNTGLFNINSGNLSVSGNSYVGGNITQNVNSNGSVKAMAFISIDTLSANVRAASIDRCYNGITGSSTGNCGFTLGTPFSNDLDINFGFQVSNRFISLTSTLTTDSRVNLFPNSTTVNVVDSGGNVRYYIFVY